MLPVDERFRLIDEGHTVVVGLPGGPGPTPPVLVPIVDSYVGVVSDVDATTTFTWTKPQFARTVMFVIQSPGGAGGSGRRGAPATVRGGGAGGSGGTRTTVTLSAAELPDTVSVVVGNGRPGAVGVVADDTDGSMPVDSVASYVEFDAQRIVAYAGGAGPGGRAVANVGSGGPLGVNTSGAPSSTGGAPDPSHVGNIAHAAPAGGSAGGVASTNLPADGALSYSAPMARVSGDFDVVPGGVIPGGPGTTTGMQPWPDQPYEWDMGAGGGGGAGNDAGPGGNGGDGVRGGGGGGGGASVNGSPSGAGGAGGPGFVQIFTYR